MTVFGPAKGAYQAEQWTKGIVSKWFVEYLAHYERENGYSPHHFDPPFSIETSSEFTYWRDDQLPHIVVVSPGFSEAPRRHGDGQWDACYAITVTAIVSGQDRADTREMQMAYGTVIAMMLLQNKGLEHPEHVRGVQWLDESFRDVPEQDQKTIGSAAETFEVDLYNIINDRGTPPADDPRDDPYVDPGNRPTIPDKAHTFVTIRKEGESS